MSSKIYNKKSNRTFSKSLKRGKRKRRTGINRTFRIHKKINGGGQDSSFFDKKNAYDKTKEESDKGKYRFVHGFLIPKDISYYSSFLIDTFDDNKLSYSNYKTFSYSVKYNTLTSEEIDFNDRYKNVLGDTSQLRGKDFGSVFRPSLCTNASENFFNDLVIHEYSNILKQQQEIAATQQKEFEKKQEKKQEIEAAQQKKKKEELEIEAAIQKEKEATQQKEKEEELERKAALQKGVKEKEAKYEEEAKQQRERGVKNELFVKKFEEKQKLFIENAFNQNVSGTSDPDLSLKSNGKVFLKIMVNRKWVNFLLKDFKINNDEATFALDSRNEVAIKRLLEQNFLTTGLKTGYIGVYNTFKIKKNLDRNECRVVANRLNIDFKKFYNGIFIEYISIGSWFLDRLVFKKDQPSLFTSLGSWR